MSTAEQYYTGLPNVFYSRSADHANQVDTTSRATILADYKKQVPNAQTTLGRSYQLSKEKGGQVMLESTTQVDIDDFDVPEKVTLMIPRRFEFRCGSGQRNAYKPYARGSMARNFLKGYLPLFGAGISHPSLWVSPYD